MLTQEKWVKFKEISEAVASGAEARIWLKDVQPQQISEAENLLGRSFPEEIKHVWLTIGYGDIFQNLNGDKQQFDWDSHLMSPLEIVDALTDKTTFSFNTDYHPELPFFYFGDGFFLVFEDVGKKFYGVRFDYDVDWAEPVAENLYDFMNKLAEDPTSFMPKE